VPRRLLRVGLTGGIATGKSHVLKRLDAAGFATIDLDHVSHALLAKGGAGFAPVVEAFGEAILDRSGSIDRKALGAIVFSSPPARQRLNAIVHPLVRAQEAAAAYAAEAAGARVLVTDAALLVEAGLHLRFDRLLVAWCPAEVQVARLRARDGIDEKAARARLAAQMPGEEKRLFADHVVDTSGTFDDTDAQVDSIVTLLRGLGPPAPVALTPSRALAALENGPAEGPRGLAPERLVLEYESALAFDLARLARALEPPAAGPWYRAAQAVAGGPGPETLAAALAVCCAARGADAPYVLSAAVTLGRLTHAGGPGVAAGCVAALAAWAVATEGAMNAIDEESLARWTAQARERVGASPPDALVSDLRRAALQAPLSGTLTGALEGLVEGAASTESETPLAAAVGRLFGR
jgi:dephospho-CoA kinase